MDDARLVLLRLGVAEERELYERAKEATEEAQREGAAQLKAAVKAGAVVKPLRDSLSWWSLGFRDSRLERAYRLKSVSYADCSDSFPVACELAACALHLIGPKMITDSPSSPVHLLGYICIAICCITVLSSQLLFYKWYLGCRVVILQYVTIMLWIWESIQIFLLADTQEWTYIAYHDLALSTCTSILYQVPFCMHLRLRIFGLACQTAAILARGDHQDNFTILFLITASHLLGILLAYIFDRRARLHFLKSMSCWKADDATGPPIIESQFSDSCRDSIFRQYWNVFCSQSLEKSSSNLSTVMIAPVDRSTPYRALGGFAGGFGGVSGLKCKFPPPVPLFSFSDSHSEYDRMSGSELSNYTNSSKNIKSFWLQHKHDQVKERWMQDTTVDSVCSQVEGRCTSTSNLHCGEHNY